MYLAALHHFFKDFWKRNGRRRFAEQPREPIDPQLYLEAVGLLHQLCLPGMKSVHLGGKIIPAQKAQVFRSSSGVIKGTLKVPKEDTIDLFIWGIDDRGVYYELSKDLNYLLALAAKLHKEQQELSFWQKLTQEQQKKSPIAPHQKYKPIQAHVHPEFAIALQTLEPNHFGSNVCEAFAFVEYISREVYHHLEQVRHNAWNQFYVWVQDNESFELDFSQEEEEALPIWQEELDKALEVSQAYFQDHA
ncbi:hypothetical protein [Psittacicella gerlachiana]|uniref:Uncharacterized protein n=1 Tax=Psittacicella gerlachiana TaxID=2028574 RepID=A0A3A1Y9R1_9GAMM|nr:hypothetical protein [Psittacicella gerlachiana]RIY34281.1 hypothetical protein CKF59_05725 [Psittacicella gerlachiana]